MSKNAANINHDKNREKRKDLSCPIASPDGQYPFPPRFNLDDTKLKTLTDTCQIVLTDDLKKAIGAAINTYFDMTVWPKVHPLRDDNETQLVEFKKRVDSLFEFLNDITASETSARGAVLEKVEIELLNDKAAFCVMMTHQREGKKRHFFNDLCSLRLATEEAIKTFKGEGVGGGPISDDATNALLLGLDDICKPAKVKKPYRKKFFYLVTQMIPNGDRPILFDGGWKTISDRIKQLRVKYSKLNS